MSTTVTTTTTHEVTLKPTLRRRLLTELRTYGELKAQRAALDLAMTKHRSAIEGYLGETGEASLSLEGYKVTLVCPITSRLDKMKLVEQGVTTAQIEAATVTTPGRSYVKVTVPGERDNSESR